MQKRIKQSKEEISLPSTEWKVAAILLGLFFLGRILIPFAAPSDFVAIDLIAATAVIAFLAFTYFQINGIEEKVRQQQLKMLSSSKFSELGEMAAGMAHEINTPLGAITLSASQLSELDPNNSEHRQIMPEIVDDILGSAEKIARIVRGLKNVSRDSTRGADFVFCDLPTVIHESLAICESSLSAKQIKLRIVELPHSLDLQCNPSQISQVLLNLVNNAKDAIENLDDRWIEITLKCSSEQVELRVTDSGSGIPSAIREKLFQPFFTTKEVGKGTGIGLSVVFGIVQKHKGDIFVDDTSPNTSFVIRLPRLQGE